MARLKGAFHAGINIYRIILEGIARIGQSCVTAVNSDIASNTMSVVF
jgi:hypothetical protein